MNREKILLVSSFPPRDTTYGKGVGGAAHFIKTLISNIKNFDFTVLSQKNTPQRQTYSQTEHIDVIECWKKDSITYAFSLAKEIFQQRHIKKMILNFEFKIFGSQSNFISIINLLQLPCVLIWAKILGIRIYTILHPALLDINALKKLEGHAGTGENEILTRIYALGNTLFLMFLAKISQKCITFEKVFKDRLAAQPLVRKEKIAVIPHHIYPPVKSATSVTPIESEPDKPHKFELLFFGFLTKYKGIDWLVDIAGSPDWPTDVHITVAGGQSATAADEEFYNALIEKMQKNPNITHTGFVEDEDIPKYFEAADLIILPYTVIIASSGPMAMAIGYKKPFILSENLEPYTQTADFDNIMEKLNLNKDMLTFKLEKSDILNKLAAVKSNPEILRKLQTLSDELNKSRGLERSATKYEEILK